MEIIEAPIIRKNQRPWKKILLIFLIILIPSAISIPFLLQHFSNAEEGGFSLETISMVNHNDTDTVTFNLELTYNNNYDIKYSFSAYEAILSMKSPSENNWQTIKSITSRESIIVPAEGPLTMFLSFNMSNEEEDASIRNFIAEILKKSDFSFKLTGTFQTALFSDDAVPDSLKFDIITDAKTFFNYEVPEAGPSILTVIDLETPGIHPSHPDDFQFGVICEYINPFPFPIYFRELNAELMNRTSNKIGDVVWNETNLGIFSANGQKNISQTLFVEYDQVSWIVSDLLSQQTDVIKLRNVMGIVEIGNVQITLSRESETENADLEFLLTITRYAIGSGGSLILDANITNPCNIEFNLTYIELNMYVTGTNQEVIAVSQSINVTIVPYIGGSIKNLMVDAYYGTFITHLNDKFDLHGNLIASSYNYQGTIIYDSTEVELNT